MRALFFVVGAIVGIVLPEFVRHAADFVQLVSVDTMTADFEV